MFFSVDLEKSFEEELDLLESEFGIEAMTRLLAFLTATEFGLSEVELLELLMPTSSDVEQLLLKDGYFNFATFCTARRRMGGYFSCFVCTKIVNKLIHFFFNLLPPSSLQIFSFGKIHERQDFALLEI